MRTNGQERAEFALKKISSRTIDKGLKSLTAGAPTVILQNGFGQAMAFWLSKGEDKYEFVFDSVKEWLKKKEIIDSNNERKDFVIKLSNLEQNKYLAAQREALLLLEWIKRYAAAFCEGCD